MTNQEIFTRVVTHLRRQGRRSRAAWPGGVSGCAYHGANGAMCAVGCLISDEAYSPNFENHSVNDRTVLEALKKSGVDATQETTLDMLERLQLMHDLQDIANWEKAFANIATDFNLELPQRREHRTF